MKNLEAAGSFPHSLDEITVDWLNGFLRDAGGRAAFSSDSCLSRTVEERPSAVEVEVADWL